MRHKINRDQSRIRGNSQSHSIPVLSFNVLLSIVLRLIPGGISELCVMCGSSGAKTLVPAAYPMRVYSLCPRPCPCQTRFDLQCLSFRRPSKKQQQHKGSMESCSKFISIVANCDHTEPITTQEPQQYATCVFHYYSPSSLSSTTFAGGCSIFSALRRALFLCTCAQLTIIINRYYDRSLDIGSRRVSL